MRSVTSARRPIEKADSAGTKAPTGRGDDDPETQGCGASGVTLSFGAGGPPAVVRQPPLPLAPLQLVGQYQKRNIAEFLTFTGASSLMLVSKDMHRAIQADPVLRLDEISPAFHRLGCNELLRRIQSADAEISRLHPNGGQSATRPQHAPESKQQAASPMPAAGAQTGSEPGGASQWFKLARARAAHAFQGKERARQAESEQYLHELEAQKAQLTTQLEALEPAVEGVVFHFAAERMKGPRPPSAADATAQAMVPAPGRYGRLHKAIEDGEVEKVRVGLREFLSLPPHLMPSTRKVAWLRQPQGVCTLKASARRCCGMLKLPERRHYEAITAYVDEILTSAHLSPAQKQQLCLKPEQVEGDQRSSAGNLADQDLVRFALRSNNPAFAASILLGIHEAHAAPELKHFLLTSIAPSRNDMRQLVDLVTTNLNRYAHRAPEWVVDMIVGMNSLVADWPAPAQIHH